MNTKKVRKIVKNLILAIDERQQPVIIQDMIIEKIREKIKTSGKSLNQIGRDTGIDKAALCRIMQGGSCKVETADILLKYFGLEIKPKKKARQK